VADDARSATLSPAGALLLAGGLSAAGDRAGAVALLRRAAVRHAGDVWVNYALAVDLDRLPHPPREEVVRYYTAARALRPETAHELGHRLRDLGRPDEAEAIFRDLVRRQPGNGRHLGCLADLLKAGHRAEEAGEILDRAIAANREAIRLKPDDARAHYNLGNALVFKGRFDDAIAAYREAIRLRPDLAEPHYNLGSALVSEGRLDDAITAYREAIRLEPDDAEAHCNLGQVLRKKGTFTESLAELRKGHDLGSRRPAWEYPSAEWVRDAERLVALESRLPAVLRGDDRPASAAERVEFAVLCQTLRRYAAAARFFAEAFADDPKRADDLESANRYNAACCAALAGCGVGKDDSSPDEAARAKLRRQALDWLRADLDAHRRRPREDRDAVRKVLAHWKVDADLSGVRDPEGLAKLPGEEQAAWRTFWAEVNALEGKDDDTRG
jgi:tetratricopeptide (TPR) repeat protein